MHMLYLHCKLKLYCAAVIFLAVGLPLESRAGERRNLCRALGIPANAPSMAIDPRVSSVPKSGVA